MKEVKERKQSEKVITHTELTCEVKGKVTFTVSRKEGESDYDLVHRINYDIVHEALNAFMKDAGLVVHDGGLNEEGERSGYAEVRVKDVDWYGNQVGKERDVAIEY